MQMTEDKELIEMLKDGDDRILPSTKMNQSVSVVSQNVPSLQNETGSSEEELMVEVENNLRTLIDYGNNAVKDLADLASQSEHPRPYEALSTMIKSVTDANMNLLAIRKKEKVTAAAARFEDPKADEKSQTISSSVADLLEQFEQDKRKAQREAVDVDFIDV